MLIIFINSHLFTQLMTVTASSVCFIQGAWSSSDNSIIATKTLEFISIYDILRLR
jgi:hypothetical protein